jgi:head-tail adaptor
MSFGKMNSFIKIVSTAPVKDADGFAVNTETILASVRAYREDRHGTEVWANRAAFSNASAMFRFRIIPGVTVDTTMIIVCDDERFRIFSAEDVRNRGMYVECLCEIITPSKG